MKNDLTKYYENKLIIKKYKLELADRKQEDKEKRAKLSDGI